MPNLNDVFLEFQKHLDSEQAIVDEVRKTTNELESLARQIACTLQVIHHDLSAESTACGNARVLFENVRIKYDKLSKSFPSCDYYRHHDIWKYVTQKLCFSAALIIWLEKGILISKETAAHILGVGEKEGKDVFHLDIEDFLIGLLELASELSRLAVNSVTMGEYSRPVQISKFVIELNAGFRLLSLKNDGLRRRFDVLKYDVKKIEDVVYDLGLRNLIPHSRPQ